MLSQLLNLFPSIKEKKQEIEKKLREADLKAKEIIITAKEKALQIEKNSEEEARRITKDAVIFEKRLYVKEQEIDRMHQSNEQERKRIDAEKTQLMKNRGEIITKVQKIAHLTPQEARELILRNVEEKLKGEIAKQIKNAEEETQAKIDEKAKELLVDAMRYGAVDYIAEYTLSTVSIPNEEIKGRIIGKEGRNIRAFELATGVDVDLEDEGMIKLSSFDAVRREIAKVSLDRLIRDGRIQPERIEEIVKKTREEIEKLIIKAGEELCQKVNVYDLPFEIVKLLGRFKYRYSYGQNMIIHTLEETKIGVALAHELKVDVKTVKLGCLLHDIGKVITDKEGSHVQLGVDLLKKYKIPQKVIDSVASHHEDVPFSSLEAVIVYIADAVSGGRPGARHEDFGEYLQRIKTIEDTARTKKGVRDAYAVQGGREFRVMVIPEEITDDDAVILAEEIKKEINEKFPTFPGQVKITIIREYRAYATSHS
ncbi:MAG TPA: ribonuclease Y [Patescibacteria group bacterium]|nr:ribonuclease Y [Patescibacteria group bacterium]